METGREKIVLEFKQVSTTKGKFRLKDISFTLPKGYICGLMGKNGAGKTTLLRHIAAEGIHYSGRILLEEKSIRKNPLWARRRIAYLTEESLFFEEKTLENNAQLFSLFYEDFSMEGWKSALEKVELSEGRIYGGLSRGERIKAHLAFAMAHKPVLYLCDEVTAGMDPVFRVEYFQILHGIIKTGEASILMTSHLMEEMEQRCDYLGILEEGRLIAYGEAPEILKGEGLWKKRN